MKPVGRKGRCTAPSTLLSLCGSQVPSFFFKTAQGLWVYTRWPDKENPVSIGGRWRRLLRDGVIVVSRLKAPLISPPTSLLFPSLLVCWRVAWSISEKFVVKRLCVQFIVYNGAHGVNKNGPHLKVNYGGLLRSTGVCWKKAFGFVTEPKRRK